MRLQKLILEHFRNHASLELNFTADAPITYILGPNAQGKTNALESIYLLALTKSFRTGSGQDLISHQNEYARVKGIFSCHPGPDPGSTVDSRFRENDKDGENDRVGGNEENQANNTAQPSLIELEIFLGKAPQPTKVLKKNGVKINTADFLGTCQVVFFNPEDLNMLYLGPDLRRHYIDILNLQINKRYYEALRGYKRTLEQRNALLRGVKEGRNQKGELQIWDDQLIEYGTFIMIERARTSSFLQQHLQTYYQKISQGNEQISLEYRHAIHGDMTEKTDPGHWHILYRKTLEDSLQQDLQTEHTNRGPHRDDLLFKLNNLPLESHASRGEYRSLLLSLKLLELKFFEEQTGKKPLLLLDDVFSELDEQRQQMLLQAIEGHQTIITSTHLDAPISGERQHEGLKRQYIRLDSLSLGGPPGRSPGQAPAEAIS